MKNYISIGITGGIGSGKSFVCQIIESMGYPVFYSDTEAKKIIQNHPTAVQGITKLFGSKAYLNGELNSKFIAKKIFTSPELRKSMNELIHPLVRSSFEEWASHQNSNLIFNEAAILFETGSYKNFDKTILVTAPLPLKLSRICKRDKLSLEEVNDRMSSQWTDEEKLPLTDFVINNDEIEPLEEQISHIIEELI